MCPHDRSIEGQFALRNVAVAHGIVDLRSSGVVDAAREVDVVVARTAGRAVGVVSQALVCAAPLLGL